jgi:hypothetical protein
MSFTYSRNAINCQQPRDCSHAQLQRDSGIGSVEFATNLNAEIDPSLVLGMTKR